MCAGRKKKKKVDIIMCTAKQFNSKTCKIMVAVVCTYEQIRAVHRYHLLETSGFPSGDGPGANKVELKRKIGK